MVLVRETIATPGQEAVNLLTNVRAKIKVQAEQPFYQAKHVSDIPVKGIKELLASLRRAGAGLLDGQIEDLSSDANFLSQTNKLDLGKIYEIRGRLINHEKFSSFMQLEQLREFLAGVFAESVNADNHFGVLKQAATKVQ